MNYDAIANDLGSFGQAFLGSGNSSKQQQSKKKQQKKFQAQTVGSSGVNASGGSSSSSASPESYKRGGKVRKTGMAKVHKGERVLTKAQAKKYRKRA